MGFFKELLQVAVGASLPRSFTGQAYLRDCLRRVGLVAEKFPRDCIEELVSFINNEIDSQEKSFVLRRDLMVQCLEMTAIKIAYFVTGDVTFYSPEFEMNGVVWDNKILSVLTRHRIKLPSSGNSNISKNNTEESYELYFKSSDAAYEYYSKYCASKFISKNQNCGAVVMEKFSQQLPGVDSNDSITAFFLKIAHPSKILYGAGLLDKIYVHKVNANDFVLCNARQVVPPKAGEAEEFWIFQITHKFGLGHNPNTGKWELTEAYMD